MLLDITPEPETAKPNARRRRALRWPPPDVAEVRFVPLPVAAPGQPPTAAQRRADKAIAVLLSLAPETSS